MGEPDASPVERASEALRTALADPRRATALAEAALRGLGRHGDPAATSSAHHALGLAARALNDVPGAIGHLRRAVAVADAAGLDRRAAEARLTLGVAEAVAGRTAAALRTLDAARPALAGGELARLEVQRAGVLWRLGRLDAALAGYRRALPVLRDAGDRLWEARALNQRGLVEVERGAFGPAMRHLGRAERLLEDLGQSVDAAGVRHNLGWCAARRGDVPAALAHFDAAEERFRHLDVPLAELPLDRCAVLLSAHLPGEARQLAEETAARLAEDRAERARAEALLACSHAALLDGDLAAARERATEARRAFVRQRRPGWVVLARLAEVRAAWVDGDRSTTALRAACRTAAALDRLGLPAPAQEARLIAGRTALTPLPSPASGDVGAHPSGSDATRRNRRRRALARRELAAAARPRRRRHAPAEQQSRAWLAQALLRLDAGDRRGALSALRAGLRAVDAHRAAIGATELRAHVSALAADLATLGQSLALASGRPEQLLAWIERWRAASLWRPPVRPPDDEALAADLAALRAVAGEVEAAAAEGRPTAGLLRRQAALEDAVRRRSRRAAPGHDPSPAPTPPSVEELCVALGERALVALAEVDGRLRAVTLAGGRARLHHLGPLADVAAEVDAARFGLRRLAAGRGSPAALAAARDAVAHAGRRLDELLLAPLGCHVADRPLVVVPPAGLHALPWALLPSCAARPVAVAPSASSWLRAAHVAASPGTSGTEHGIVLVAGPDLPGAAAEVADLAALHPGARCLAGPEAVAAAALAGLDGARLAHVASHGTFRVDNPLFSSLRLADGPLTVYDLEALRRAPRTLVLAACDSGLAAVRPGDELLGLAAALFPLGTAALVASVVPVPDGASRQLMVALHRRLRVGDEPAAALLAARRGLDAGDPAGLATAAAYVCLGAG